MSLAAPIAWLEGPPPPQAAAPKTRRVVVTPAMCGYNSLLVGQIGDWTWDAVSEVCGTDVLRARSASGAPSYLSFYYYRVRGSRRFHLRTPTFGDRLQVTSRVFGWGSESVMTLHRVAFAPDGSGLDVDDFYAFDRDDCLYVENLNRWISRSDEASNRFLVPAAPPDFSQHHLPRLPDRLSPRAACHRARTELTFRDPVADPNVYVPAGPEVHADYEVDASRDLNAVGLLYFATYFSIVDWALLRWWRSVGRDDSSFLGRVVVDQRLCYLGNADAGTVVGATVRPWRAGSGEVVDVVLADRAGGRLLAVSTLELLPPT
jgi:probable biosynthetic protein (TIGR04098 family)